ncbi:universal stress protein [Actinoplanes auranticolor]|uniref:universal stress protein n=1 Tax=Actinoplanes auranticolor TaxID=47988 RepID=UPI003F68E842
MSERYVPDPSQRTADDLLQVIKEELGDNPAVLVKAQVKQGRAAKVLIEESADADLLVVGERGHGGFAGLVLGSVSQHVAAYAKCPVTVVRQAGSPPGFSRRSAPGGRGTRRSGPLGRSTPARPWRRFPR